MRKLVPLLAATALAAAACGSSGGSGGGSTLKIGFIESLSGNYAPLGGGA